MKKTKRKDTLLVPKKKISKSKVQTKVWFSKLESSQVNKEPRPKEKEFVAKSLVIVNATPMPILRLKRIFVINPPK